MENKKTQKIIEYYNERVSQHGLSGKSTLLDDNMRALEIETAKSWLNPNDKVLDLFCGNGVSTTEFSKNCKSITGIDLSEKMIEAARKLMKREKTASRHISFEKRNVLDIADIYPVGHFNTVISVRGLINLPSWKLQQRAILNIHRILPTGGKLIFIEGSGDGLQKINKLRAKFSLKALKEPWYDKHFKSSILLKFMSEYFNVCAERNLGVYFLISRVFYPLASFPKEPRFDHICNTVARLIVPYVKANINTTLLICKCFVKK